MKITGVNTYLYRSDIKYVPADYKKNNISINNNVISSEYAQYLRSQRLYNCGFYGNKGVSVYAIDSNGQYKKYQNQAQANKELNIAPGCISLCLQGKRETAGGYKFVLANDVEIKNKDGSVSVDEKVISDIYNKSKNQAVYMIDKDGNYQKFRDVNTAAESLDVIASNIRSCLAMQRKSAGGYTFIYAEDVETRTDSGEIIVDMKLISDLSKTIPDKSIYAIGPDGSYQKFSNHKTAAEALGVYSCNISVCLDVKNKTSGGYSFLTADEVETTGQDGSLLIDKQKMTELAIANNKGVYSLGKDGVLRKFESQTAAAIALSVNPSTLSQCLKGNRKSTGGYRFFFVKDIEKPNPDGSIYIDEEKLKGDYYNYSG